MRHAMAFINRDTYSSSESTAVSVRTERDRDREMIIKHKSTTKCTIKCYSRSPFVKKMHQNDQLDSIGKK